MSHEYYNYCNERSENESDINDSTKEIIEAKNMLKKELGINDSKVGYCFSKTEDIFHKLIALYKKSDARLSIHTKSYDYFVSYQSEYGKINNVNGTIKALSESIEQLKTQQDLIIDEICGMSNNNNIDKLCNIVEQDIKERNEGIEVTNSQEKNDYDKYLNEESNLIGAYYEGLIECDSKSPLPLNDIDYDEYINRELWKEAKEKLQVVNSKINNILQSKNTNKISEQKYASEPDSKSINETSRKKSYTKNATIKHNKN